MSTEKNQKERKNSRAVKIIKEFSERIMGDHVGAYAAQSAFFILLSFIPFMMLLLNIIQYTPLTEEAVSSAVMSIVITVRRLRSIPVNSATAGKYSVSAC